MCNGSHEINIKDQTCSIIDEYVMSSRGICQERKGECNATQWLLYYLMISNVFSISSHMVFTIQITFSLMLIAHTHRPTHSYILYIECESNTSEKRKGGKKKLLISIHTACKWISENCEKGAHMSFFFSRSVVQCGNNTIWKCTKTKSNRNDAYISKCTHLHK